MREVFELEKLVVNDPFFVTSDYEEMCGLCVVCVWFVCGLCVVCVCFLCG